MSCRNLQNGVASMLGCCALMLALIQSSVLHAEPAKVTSPAAKQPVTFNGEIAAMIHDKCVMCHRPGQVGPFPLLTYDDVRKRAQTIEAVIDSGYMPPWKPVNQNVTYTHDRRLDDDQKAMFKAWVAAGSPPGDEPQPVAPEFPDGWALGQPDLVVTMNGQYKVPASGPDIYRSFVFPVQLPEDKWVKAIELRPKAKTAVHHALFFVDRGGVLRSKDGEDGQPGIGGMGIVGSIGPRPTTNPQPNRKSGLAGLLSRLPSTGSGFDAFQLPDVDGILADSLGAFVPGSMPHRLPGDLGKLLPKGSDVIMQTHFHPSGKPEVEQAELALYFADQPPSQLIVPVQVPPLFGVGAGLKIPAGESDYRLADSFELPIAVKLISVGAHAHYIGREASMTATLPDGTEQTLLEIDDWDLDWQDSYFFAEPIELPAGTVLTTELSYDNSADNPENPNDPPQPISWGRQSDDEMGSVILGVVAVDESQREQLEQAVQQYSVASVMDAEGITTLLNELDENSDGILQPNEVPPNLAKGFVVFDRDGSGALEQQEYKTLKQLAGMFGTILEVDRWIKKK